MAGSLIDRKSDIIRGYYNEQDKANSDYDYIYPITLLENVKEGTHTNSSDLRTILQVKDNELNDGLATKQNKIEAGHLNNIVAFSGVDGVVNELPRVSEINPNIMTASDHKIPSERSIVRFNNDVINPNIRTAKEELRTEISEVEDSIAATNDNVTTNSNRITNVQNELLGTNNALITTNLNLTSVTDDVEDLESTINSWSSTILNPLAPDSVYDVQRRVAELEENVVEKSDFENGNYIKTITVENDEAGVKFSHLQSNVGEVVDSLTTTKLTSSDDSVEFTLNTVGSVNVVNVKAAVTPELLDTKISANMDITPGTGTKVTYDAKGLITGSTSLTALDIPDITVDQVTGLQAVLNEKTEESDFLELSDTVSRKANSSDVLDLGIVVSGKVNSNPNIIPGTGTKFTFDAQGLILSSESLVATDIPDIGISQVTDLEDTIDGLALKEDLTTLSNIVTGKVDQVTFNALQQTVNNKVESNSPIAASTGIKISYDGKGLVTGSSGINVNDLTGGILITDVQGLQDSLTSKANQTDLTNLSTVVNGKMDQLSTITPGTGFKITYDKYGVITSSNDLLATDIPDINISQVIGLDNKLNTLALESDLQELSNTVDGKVDAPTSPLTPATGCKVTIDEQGLVTAVSDITIKDLAVEPVIGDIVGLPSALDEKASVSDLNQTNTNLGKKLDAPETPIVGGSFTKVSVDTNGLVTSGSNLIADDIPELSLLKVTDGVNNLGEILEGKASVSEVTAINTEIATTKVNINTLVSEYADVLVQALISKGVIDAGDVDFSNITPLT